MWKNVARHDQMTSPKWIQLANQQYWPNHRILNVCLLSNLKSANNFVYHLSARSETARGKETEHEFGNPENHKPGLPRLATIERQSTSNVRCHACEISKPELWLEGIKCQWNRDCESYDHKDFWSEHLKIPHPFLSPQIHSRIDSNRPTSNIVRRASFLCFRLLAIRKSPKQRLL